MKLFPIVSALVTTLLLESSIQSRASQVIPHQGLLEYTEYRLDFTGPTFHVGDKTPLSETVGDLQVNYTENYLGLGGTFTLVDATSIPTQPTPTPVLAGDLGAHWLFVSFSEKMFGIVVEYVDLAMGMGPISMQLFDGLDPVGGPIGGHGYPEGLASLLPVCICPNSFDGVLISDSDISDPSFAVRQITAYHSPTPDSGSTLSFVAIGLFGIVALKLCGRTSYRRVMGVRMGDW